jgi:hypothetical protein
MQTSLHAGKMKGQQVGGDAGWPGSPQACWHWGQLACNLAGKLYLLPESMLAW